MSESVGDVVGDVLGKIADIPNWILRLGNNYRTKSLIEVTQVGRVEPLTVVSSDLIGAESTELACRSVLDIFIGYYLQAVALSSKIDNVRVTRILDRINPDRHFNELMLTTENHSEQLSICREAYEFRLPTMKNQRALHSDISRVNATRYMWSTEAPGKGNKGGGGSGGSGNNQQQGGNKSGKGGSKNVTQQDLDNTTKEINKQLKSISSKVGSVEDKMDEHRAKNPEPYMPNSGLDDLDKIHVLDEDQRKSLDKDGGSSMDKDMVTKVLMADANMAVGKLITVDININNKKVQVPITFRLATATLTEQSITHLLALKTEDEGIVERYHAWRAGRIGLIKDLIFCQDLIDEHKKALMTDKDGVYSEIVKRVNNAKKYGILADNPSLVSASNIFIISEAVASQVELKLGGKLRNPRIREKAFLNTYAMILVVIDRDYDRATFYHRGIDMPTEVSFKEMKKSAQGKGPDIMDIMKAYNTGMPPSL